MNERVLILGAKGLLGRALQRHVPAGITAFARDKDDLPLEDPAGIARLLREEAVDRVFCLAAWTQVDACEEQPDLAFRVNGILPGRVAALTERLGIGMLFLSTDYVFDGTSDHPYREYDPAHPLGIYARSKWYGERAVREFSSRATIVRTSGLFGSGGPDFVQAIRQRLREGPVRVVTDEINAPTWVDHLAPALWRLGLDGQGGTWHLAAQGEVSRYEMACRIAELTGAKRELVLPTTHAELGRPAPRPQHSTLDCQAAREAFGLALPEWDQGLSEYLSASGKGN